MAVTFIRKPVKPVAVKVTYAKYEPEVSTPAIKYVETEPVEPVKVKINIIKAQPQKTKVFMGYDAKGRPVFVEKDEPEAKE
ncbi:hypothetical protein PQQ87_24195 [Paraburkholderia nemoris]|uniref:hypothetical protein n=1 Tax=Paraburkholderia nemoris TaxID=2793076 RepID=UPI0038B72028